MRPPKAFLFGSTHGMGHHRGSQLIGVFLLSDPHHNPDQHVTRYTARLLLNQTDASLSGQVLQQGFLVIN